MWFTVSSYLRFMFAIAGGIFLGLLFWNAFTAFMLSFVISGIRQIF